jgi:NADPH-dependent curcumin reductase CurA
MATRIDTLKTYEAIAAAGVDDKAARAISAAIADSASDYRADFATKSDLELLRSDVNTKFAELGKSIADGKVDTLKAITDGTRWNIGVVLAVGGALAAAVKFL